MYADTDETFWKNLFFRPVKGGFHDWKAEQLKAQGRISSEHLVKSSSLTCTHPDWKEMGPIQKYKATQGLMRNQQRPGQPVSLTRKVYSSSDSLLLHQLCSLALKTEASQSVSF